MLWRPQVIRFLCPTERDSVRQRATTTTIHMEAAQRTAEMDGGLDIAAPAISTDTPGITGDPMVYG